MKAPSLFHKHSAYSPLIRRGLILAVLLVIQPFLWQYVYAVTGRLQEKRTEAQQLSNLQKRLDDINAQLKNQQQYVDQLTSSFPLLGSESQLIERVEQLGQRVGITAHIKNLAKQPVAGEIDRGKILTSLTITIETQGTPASLLQYIDALEHVQELSSVREVNITQQAAVSGSAKQLLPYTMTMNVVFYLQKNSHGR